MELKKFIGKSGFVLAVSSALLVTACNKDDNSSDPTPTDNTITGVVVASADFSTLKDAVIKADLQTTLSGAGPFTVFAPDNAAFTASGIDNAALASLTADQVKAILLYHTLPAKVMAADVPAGPNAKVTTAGGDSVFVTKNANGVFVNGVKVTQADISASNGVIHRIGRVLLPPAGNIVETAVAAGLDSLVKAVTLATTEPGGDPNLAQTLSTATLTVFAPTNQAFTQLLGNLGLSKLEDIPVATLLAVLQYHVVGGRAFSSDLANGNLAMLANGNTTVGLTDGTNGGPTITGNGNAGAKSNIIATNIVCRNGVVHLIDRVLLP
ncbi:MAG TPA: fasciclin domain-containing protein [Chitinophagaceae bacterium]|jgi:uncharacterized surface protein with fasciclin (FAS1) repeats|nr:fasciclin domain-containing protein [Chitinophagaceae bacterium]